MYVRGRIVYKMSKTRLQKKNLLVITTNVCERNDAFHLPIYKIMKVCLYTGCVHENCHQYHAVHHGFEAKFMDNV